LQQQTAAAAVAADRGCNICQDARRSAFHLAKQQPKYKRSANDLWQNIIKEVGETHLSI